MFFRFLLVRYKESKQNSDVPPFKTKDIEDTALNLHLGSLSGPEKMDRNGSVPSIRSQTEA